MFCFPCNSQLWKNVISIGNFYLTSMCGHFSSLRFKHSIIEKLNIIGISSYVKIELFSHVYDARQHVDFPLRFLDTLYM
jgi:hypothetical protein